MNRMNTSIVTEKVCTGGLIVPLLDALPEALLYIDAEGVVEAASGRFEEFQRISRGNQKRWLRSHSSSWRLASSLAMP